MTAESELPPGFTASDDLEQIKVTVWCNAVPGCSAETPCASCQQYVVVTERAVRFPPPRMSTSQAVQPVKVPVSWWQHFKRDVLYGSGRFRPVWVMRRWPALVTTLWCLTMRSCRASHGRCSCGWVATGPDTAAETIEHLYGDLTGAARRFAYTGWRDR